MVFRIQSASVGFSKTGLLSALSYPNLSSPCSDDDIATSLGGLARHKVDFQ
jgi:hypothetical protein